MRCFFSALARTGTIPSVGTLAAENVIGNSGTKVLFLFEILMDKTSIWLDPFLVFYTICRMQLQFKVLPKANGVMWWVGIVRSSTDGHCHSVIVTTNRFRTWYDWNFHLVWLNSSAFRHVNRGYELTCRIFLLMYSPVATRSPCSLPWNWAVSWRCQELHARCKRRRKKTTLQWLGTLLQVDMPFLPKIWLNWALTFLVNLCLVGPGGSMPSSGRVLSLQWWLGWKRVRAKALQQVIIWMKGLCTC